MADLQEELQQFLTARFGADVRDAFVSCIRKIHAENLDVVALDESMQEAAEEVKTAKADMEKSLFQTEETVRGIANSAKANAETAAKTAEDAKAIARSAESNASDALATAKNAKDESFNAAGDAELAMSAAQDVKQSFSNMELLLSSKVDGAFVENGYLYLTSNNEVVAGPLGPFSGSGGSGGSSGNNAVLAVSNTSGWLSKSIAYGKECPIQITWSSLEDEMPTGNGVMKVTVNGIVKAMLDIAQGAVTADIGPYLNVGSNAVRIQVSDVYENSRTINFNVNAIEASISSTFDAGTPFEGIITFTYVPVGNISKTVHILLDGKELTMVTTSSSGRQMHWFPKHGKSMDTFRAEVKALLATDTETEDTTASEITTDTAKKEVYRVRKTWADSKSQIGAYRVLKNAKAAADKNPGTFVFNSTGTAIYPESYRIHTVVHGDTLWKIAAQYLGSGSRYKEIVRLNTLTSNVIYSGMKLKIPN